MTITYSYPKLLDNQTSDGTGTVVTLHQTKSYNLYSYGDFGEGSVAIEWSVDNGATFTAFTDCSDTALALTTPGTETFFTLEKGTQIRAVLSGSTAPSVTVELR